MPDAAHFGPEFFAFYRDLIENNDRAWFTANKARYEEHVREPMLRFIADFAPLLRRISRRFVADPRPVGGSLFRIYRDVRFSKNKTPYKTHAAARFQHRRAKDVHAPGFYLGLQPGQVHAAAGIWHPDAKALKEIRETLVARSQEWQTILRAKRFAGSFALEGDALKRGPKGFPPDHPLIEDLKRKDFVAVSSFTEDDATAPDFLARYAERCRAAAPLVKYLTEALELEW